MSNLDRANKGNIAVHKVCADLLTKNHHPFVQAGEFGLPVDVVVLTSSGKLLKLQVKYSSSGQIYNRVNGYSTTREYTIDDFDYYAIYLADVDKVVYPHVSFGCITISTTIRMNVGGFWWFEDFLDWTDVATKRKCEDFGIDVSFRNAPRPSRRKCERPPKEVLYAKLWEMPTTDIAKMYGVSDNAISRWAKDYGLDKPPRGYWTGNK